MNENSVYKIIFANQGSIYEIYAKQIVQSNLFGFIEVEALLFNNHSAVLVDPAEEKLKNEFNGVKRVYVPMHSIVRIDEVEKQGTSKIKEGQAQGQNVTPFPGQNFFTSPSSPPKN